MTNQEISLKWNGYQSNILYNVKELYKDEGLSDVTVVSEGQSFKAHKVVLSASSNVFRTIFQQNPHKDPIIVLHDINTNALRSLLIFMYNGEVNVTEDFLPILLKTAETLRICGLFTGSDTLNETSEKNTSVPSSRKRKKSESEDTNKNKKQLNISAKIETAADVAIVIPKIEPSESPLTEYSGENTNDTDTSLLEDVLPKKYSASIDKSICLNGVTKINAKKWINEVTSTQPCLNILNEKNICNTNESVIKDKDYLEIDKEVETVLQSGTMVESLGITTENLNIISTEAQICKNEKASTCYANPSFPCPFCPRVYNSWGYRRRHVKSRHLTNRLSCKCCVAVLSSTGAWYSHATKVHSVTHEEARNSLVVMVEAHSVLTLQDDSKNN